MSTATAIDLYDPSLRLAKGFGNEAAETDMAAGVADAGSRYPGISAGGHGDGGCRGNYLTVLRGDHGDRSKTPGRCRQDFHKHLGAEIPSYL